MRMQRENKDDQKKRDQDKKEKALLEARKEAYNERVALAKKVEERRAEEDKKRYDAEAD
jgi:hypothetical protein